MQKSNTYLAIALGAAVIILGAGAVWRGYQNSKEMQAGPAALTASLIDGASYRFPIEDKAGTVQFTNGVYEYPATGRNNEPASGKLQILSDYTATGDLNGDGAPDTAVAVAETNGVSGVYVSVEAMLNKDGVPTYAANFYLGDQIEITSMNIKNGVLTVKYLSHRPDDYLNDPTLLETLNLKLMGNSLVAI